MRKKALLTSLAFGILVLAGFAIYFRDGFFRHRENIVFKSQIENITVSSTNTNYFSKTLKERGFWSENSIFTNDGLSVKPVLIKNLTIVLQPNEQRWGGIMSQKTKKRVASFDFESIGDTGIISIWIDTNHYKTQDSINKVFTKVLYESVFTINQWGIDPDYRLDLPIYLNSVEQEKTSGEFINPVLLTVK
ncbi:MAG: hypothetical protein COU68_04335 [Candidatus Pacebacteria bacterium CG10_big_fil_rev_8_21_14_0_10_45_6]|nr:MAG: hypothetical protein COU68_04335 [Candidatus Pacebacteria bacterium CG10_big_fil_rev_8_21_14_0_10_45_6]